MGLPSASQRPWHANRKQDRDALAKPLQQEVEGTPVVKTKVLHLFRSVQLSKLYGHATQHCYSALQNVTKKGRHSTCVCRDSGVVLLAIGGAGSELLIMWGRPTGYTLESTLSCANDQLICHGGCLAALGTRHITVGKIPLSVHVSIAIAPG